MVTDSTSSFQPSSGQIDSTFIMPFDDYMDAILPELDSLIMPIFPYDFHPLFSDSLPSERLKKQHYEDKWLNIDKFHHFAYSFGITGIGYHIYHCQLENPSKEARVFSISLTTTLSIGKECYDKFKKKTLFSCKDLFFDALGISAATILLAR